MSESPDEAVAREFEELRPQLVGAAYRVLGSMADAEDAVQETWLRWAAADRTEVRDARAYLLTVATRQALNRIRQQQSRREDYVGPDGVEILHQGEGRFVVARIGDASSTISGQHVYDISYRIDGVLAERGKDSEFYWNLIPSGWRMPIAQSSLTVTLPGDPGKVLCAVGSARPAAGRHRQRPHGECEDRRP